MTIKKRYIATLVAIGICIGWLTLGGTQSVLYATSSTEFCVSCHSMDIPYQEYQGTRHFNNVSGVRAECSNCHIPSNTVDYLLTKGRASKDIYHEFVTRKIDTPEKYENHRAAMAETVWKQMRANDSATCRSCHKDDAVERFDQTPDAQKMHQYARDNDQTCIDCHKGIAHQLPEMKMDSKALDHLVELAKQTPAQSAQAYPFKPTPLGELATINPATALTVLDTQGDTRTVELKGFQMEGAEQVIYVAEGQRAIVAQLTDAGQAAVQAGTYQADQYGNKWRSARLQGEINTPILPSRDALWRYAEQLDNVYCSACHAKIPAKHFTVNAWPSVAKSMGDRTAISVEDLDILTKYFQYNAKDFVAN
ncbi:NapC/NirT family cytochrome c [Aeromonas sp. MdU4]|uniref:NapC/NirT family cytochrome c n=1 Tax=Aeromonas sp. MdU4 TaxID=3342819 RepID=UPI0035BA9867